MKSKICKMCKSEFSDKNRKKVFCSLECLSRHRSSDEYRNNVAAKRRSTSMQKYGVDNPAKSNAVKKKTAETVLSRYGAASPTLNSVVRQKQIDTCRDRYGADTPLQSDVVIGTIRNSLQANLGVNTPFESPVVQLKSRRTKLDRYDDEFYNNNHKRENTCVERYGVNNPSVLPVVKMKATETCQLKYNANSPLENVDIKKKAIDAIQKNYGVDTPMDSLVIRDRIINTNRERYGTDYAIQSSVVQLKRVQTCRTMYYNDLRSRFSDIVELQFAEEEYVGGIDWTMKYPFKCVKCGNQFEDTVISNHVPRCPSCYPIHSGTSRLEGELYDLIKSIYCGPIVRRDKSILGKLEVDFYLPEKNIAFELNGNYWHSEVSGKKNKLYHVNKTDRCEAAGVHLVHIFDDEMVEKRRIIDRKIRHLLGVDVSNKIFARRCNIVEISSKLSNEFLDEYHIQGADNSSIRFGAYFGDTLVSVMTFGPLRRSLGFRANVINTYEMYRFCVNGNVVGILGKLLNAFIRKYSPTKIITYADRRYSVSSNIGYTRVGFSVVKITNPNYWYINTRNYSNREHRYKYRKSELNNLLPSFDPTKTEWENMKLNGYDRIWDCGSVRLEWTQPK